MPRKIKMNADNKSHNKSHNESVINENQYKEAIEVNNNDLDKSNHSNKSNGLHEQKDKDSSEISDIDENESLSDCFNYDVKKEDNVDNIDEEAQTEYVKNVVFDYVIKYIKIDDIIKKKQNEHKKEMKAIKDTKDQLETFLLNYLEKVNQEYVELANKSKLTKTETTTKSAPKLEDITLCLMDGFKEFEIYENDEEIKRVVSDLVKKIDDKRETKTRTFLRRVNINKKPKKEDDKKEKNENGSVQKQSKQSKQLKQSMQSKESKKSKQLNDQIIKQDDHIEMDEDLFPDNKEAVQLVDDQPTKKLKNKIKKQKK